MYNPKLHFHFTGIGGSGMSGIAEVLLNLGFRVSGTDVKRGEVCKRLERSGAMIAEGHAAEHVPEGASLLVYSSAVREDNCELVEARRRGIPVIRRAEVLAELMRLKYGVAVAGSHGKTTTTSMIAAVFEEGGLDPTVIIGGQVRSKGTGSRVGKGDFLVAETDESDRSFLLLKPTIAVVTNIDSEHLSAYASLHDLEQSFDQFVQAVPFYGLAVLCIDDRRVRELGSRYRGRKISYGVSPDADIRALNIQQSKGVSCFDVMRGGEKLASVHLPLPGRHLVVNSLAAFAVGIECGLAPEGIAQALNQFSGVERRLEIIDEVAGVTVINDYAHHPTEIRASLRAIREGWQGMGSMHVVFQPHRYTRTKECFVDFLEAFQDCDRVFLTEIYAASEDPIEGISGQLLCEALAHPSKQFIASIDSIPDLLVPQTKPGDVVVCMGAGSIGLIPEKIISALSARK